MSSASRGYFNPRSPHGERPSRQQSTPAASNFNPRSPHGERRHPTHRRPEYRPFQSTLPARGATRAASQSQQPPAISIHAPRTGSDNAEANQKFRAISISIHAPRTGSDLSLLRFPANVHDFNPRSPHGERPDRASPSGGQGYFNPRSPHGERPLSPATFSAPVVFQSTLPARGATIARELVRELLKISIHAPRTGSDPRAGDERGSGKAFQSTLPARGATAGDDLTPPDECHFNPRSPHGERLAQGYQINPTTIFQSTLPARGATLSKLIVGPAPEFQSTLPARGATSAQFPSNQKSAISIHAPRTGSDLLV